MFQTLVLSLPTRNSTLRMRVWRALKDCGAAVLRDGVYLLPQAEAFDKLEKEIRAHGGFAMTFDATSRTYVLSAEFTSARAREKIWKATGYLTIPWATHRLWTRDSSLL